MYTSVVVRYAYYGLVYHYEEYYEVVRTSSYFVKQKVCQLDRI